MTRRVFVAGGAGGVGAGVVEAWLAAGATVVTTSRSDAKLDELRARVADRGGTLIARRSSGEPADLASLAIETGPFDQVVASIGGGGWRLAPLRSIDEPMFRRVVEDGIVAHWAFARALRPSVARGGSYVFVNGGAAKEIVPGAGPLSLVARAQLALAAIFAAEQPADHPIRTVSLVLASPIKTPSRGDRVQASWLTPRESGEACVRIHGMERPPSEIVIATRADVDALA